MYHRIYVYWTNERATSWSWRCAACLVAEHGFDNHELARQAAESHERSVHSIGEGAAVVG